MERLGHEAYELIWDFEVIQRQWAKENDFTVHPDTMDVRYFDGADRKNSARRSLLSGDGTLYSRQISEHRCEYQYGNDN